MRWATLLVFSTKGAGACNAGAFFISFPRIDRWTVNAYAELTPDGVAVAAEVYKA